jgi:phosphoribosylglycinamide formyltransferase-1
VDTFDFYKPDLIVLAGFLLKIPDFVVRHYPDKIVNIHPSLLPKFGGKGMYGHHVHEAVVAHGETESGITIHLVNEHYDEGTVLLQKRTPILPSDSAEDVAKKVLQLEHEWYAQVIESILKA